MVQNKNICQYPETKPEHFDSTFKPFKVYTRVIYLVISVVILFVLSSCSKWLDIKPQSETVLKDYWKNESQATAVVAACYKALESDGCMSRMIVWGEGRSDNVVTYSIDAFRDYDLKHLVMFDFTTTNQFCSWGPFYTVINYCNTFLHYAPGVLDVDKNFTQAKLNSLTAEVLTIRSLAYFYLVRAYKRVPWIENPSINDIQDYNVTQSEESEVIANILRDLQIALLTAPTTYGTVEQTKGRVTKNAIKALLADVYLWDMQYANCVQMCNQIIADTDLKFVDLKKFNSTYKSLFGEGNSTESIFELQFGKRGNADKQQFNNIVWNYYRGEFGLFNGSKFAFSNFLAFGTKSPFSYKVGTNTESEKDIRLRDFTLGNGDVNFILKYTSYQRVESQDGNSSIYYWSSKMNWIVYRLCDIMLMKAEALVQLNSGTDLQEALDLVNATYLRSNTKSGADSLKMENYSTQEALAELVLRERQRELLFEGKRWFDLMRLARRANSTSTLVYFVAQKFTESAGKINSNSSMNALYLPVNKYDLEANPNLTQNPYFVEANETSSSASAQSTSK